MNKHTPGPWRWQGEDYRGGWGWQLLVGPNDEGIACGEGKDGPYKHLGAHTPIEPKYCKTGFTSDDDSAPAIHVRQADARLIVAAPELLEALKDAASVLSGENMSKSALIRALEKARTAITKATGEQQ